ncbi:MAG: hypothetical protein M1834_004625 [Cirrosporium novae-zelandiae]|nr:MAG: hypothetical protein M1834_004625 [Cirrosporium novae-zelandiae]
MAEHDAEKESALTANQAQAQAEAGVGADTYSPTTAANKEISSDDSITEGETGAETGAETAAAQVGQPIHKKVAPEDQRSTQETFILVFALCMAVFLAALDITIITTALPTIAAHFHAGEAGYVWIGSAYLLANAATVPLWGKISDIFGRKPILLTANVVFLVGSLICGLAVSITMLIVGRAIQGIGGGGLVCLVNICISDLFSMRRRGAYYGIVGMVWAFASGIGPIIGGAFSEKVSWRWCFYVNLPCDGIAFLILLFFLKVYTPRTPIIEGLLAIDWLGSLTVVGATLMLLLGLEFGGVSYPWASATVICLIVFGIVTYGLFLLNESHLAKYPVTPPRIFHDISNCASFAVCFCHGFTFISGSYYLPLYFQSVLGATPILSGVYLFPFVLSLSFGSAASGMIIRKTGRYLELIRTGMFLMTLGYGLFIDLPVSTSWARIIIFQIVAGLGVGPNFQSPLISLQAHINPRDIATATATFQFVRQMATSMGVVIGSVIFNNKMAAHRQDFVDAGISSGLVTMLAGGSAGSSVSLIKALPESQKLAVRKAYTESLSKMWIIFIVVGGIGFALSFLISKKALSKQHEVVKTGLEEQKKHREERKRLQMEKKERDEEMGNPETGNNNEHSS